MDQRVRAAIDFMNANLHRKLTPAEIAGTVHLSVDRVRQLFRAETGTTLRRYLRDLRLEQARQLLETTFLSAKEIAAHVGLSGLGHFTREFKKTYRVTPARYAGRYRNATQNL